MRRLVLVHLLCVIGLAIPAIVRAQATTPPASSSSTAGAQAKPAAPAQPAPAPEEPHSLFDQTWHQFQFGGRLTSIDGDPARFQRYQDMRDGVLFTDAKYASEAPEGDWLFRATADNLGWRDQRYFADYERTGRFKVSGLWDSIPQFYSVDTATPYTHTGDNLVLDDATQRSIQSGQANLSAWIPLAPQFELHERRDIGTVNFVATPTPQIDLKASFTTQRHVGQLPWGASFGFGNDVEVPLPYDSRTNDFTPRCGVDEHPQHAQRRVHGIVVRQPRHAADLGQSAAPGRLDERSGSRPDRALAVELGADGEHWRVHQVRASHAAHGVHLVRILEQRRDAAAVHHQLGAAAAPDAENHRRRQGRRLVDKPQLRVASRRWTGASAPGCGDTTTRTIRRTSPSPSSSTTTPPSTTSSTGGPELYAHNRTTFDADATWSGLQPLSRSRSATAATTPATTFASSRAREKTRFASPRTPSVRNGSRSGRTTSCRGDRDPVWTRICSGRLANSRPCAITTSPTGHEIDSPGRWMSRRMRCGH